MIWWHWRCAIRTYIAGSTGMVGQSLISCAPSNHQIFKTTRAQLDLTDFRAVKDYFIFNRIQTVIMAAARVGGILANSENQEEFLLENLKIQNSIIEAAKLAKVENFLFLGSSCIYPKYAEQPIKEESLLTGALEATNEGYALAKICGIRLCQAIYGSHDYNYFSLMPSNLYGPNDNFHQHNAHVPAALMRRFHEAKIRNLDTVSVWGSGNPRREFMHVNDLARACWYFLDKQLGGSYMNIGTGVDISIRDFAYLMAKVTGYSGEIQFDTEIPDGTPVKLLDIKKALSLGWKPTIELSSGLEQTYSWFVDAFQERRLRGFE
jgi:GDP-L-fucose synthase